MFLLRQNKAARRLDSYEFPGRDDFSPDRPVSTFSHRPRRRRGVSRMEVKRPGEGGADGSSVCLEGKR